MFENDWQKLFILGVFGIAFFSVVQLLLKLQGPRHPLEHSLRSEYQPFSQVGGSQRFYHPAWEKVASLCGPGWYYYSYLLLLLCGRTVVFILLISLA